MKITDVRKFMERTYLGLPLALLIFITSCAQVDSISPRVDGDFTEAVNNQEVTDIDVFIGVMFLDGVVGEKLDNLQDFNITNLIKDEAQIEKVRAVHQQVAMELLANDANYMKEFRANVTSGEYYRVKTTLEKTSNDVMNAMATLSNQSVEALVEKGNAFLTALSDEHQLNAEMTQSEIAAVPQQEIKEEDDNNVWLWVVAVVAAVAVAVVFWVAIINDDKGDAFLMEEYLTTVTLELDGMQLDF